MKKIIIFLIDFFLIIFTSITKNSTKKIENKIYDTEENLRLLKNKYEMILLDYNYLSSPQKLLEYQSKFFENELVEVDIINLKRAYLKENNFLIREFKINKKND